MFDVKAKNWILIQKILKSQRKPNTVQIGSIF